MSLPKFDVEVPEFLKRTQEWFAEVITRPISMDNEMMPISPRGVPMIKEAKEFISASPTLPPHRRIEIYNQQYWWRLLKILHESFPLVTRLFGYSAFNQLIGMPYLCKYPANHWSLCFLGSRLSQWIQDHYPAKDMKLIYNAACIDYAFEECFIVKELPSLNENGMDETILLGLQPHIRLFAMDYDLFNFRDIFIKKEVNHWLENDFPKLIKGRPFYFIVYRSNDGGIYWKEISDGEYYLLQQFQRGSSLSQACDYLGDHHPEVVEQVAQHIQEWFQNWVIRRWLVNK